MDKLPTGRIRYTPKDVEIITGYCPEKAREEYEKMRKVYNLEPDDYLTVFMVSECKKIPVEELILRMRP